MSVSRALRAIVVAFVVIVCFAGMSVAGAPDVMNYQGRLTDNIGNPLNGTFSLTFNLYNVPAGGASLWTETHPNVSVADGLFNVLLGEFSGLTADEFSNPQRYLGVTVEADPELAPRTQIGSVGFAYRVGTIDSASGGTVVGDILLQSTGGVNAMEIAQGGLGRGLRIGMDNAGSSEYGLVIAMQGGGSAIAIAPDGGGPAIDVFGGFGDASVNLPAQSISGFEILDSSVTSADLTNEPGAAQGTDTDIQVLTGNLESVGSVTMNAPSGGYALIMTTVTATVVHTTGTLDAIEFGISVGTPNSLNSDQQKQLYCPSALPSATYKYILSSQKIVQTFFGEFTYHVSARNLAGSGTKSISAVTVSAIFVPTAYGTVTE